MQLEISGRAGHTVGLPRRNRRARHRSAVGQATDWLSYHRLCEGAGKTITRLCRSSMHLSVRFDEMARPEPKLAVTAA